MQQSSAATGLERISHAGMGTGVGTGTSYVFDATGGTGIVAYVVDTGILVSHSEFGGRATFGANFLNTVVSFLVSSRRVVVEC